MDLGQVNRSAGKLLVLSWLHPSLLLSQVYNLVENATQQAYNAFNTGDHFCSLCLVEDSIAALYLDGQAVTDSMQVRAYIYICGEIN